MFLPFHPENPRVGSCRDYRGARLRRDRLARFLPRPNARIHISRHEFTLQVTPLDFRRFKPDRADVSRPTGKITTYLRSIHSVNQLSRISSDSMARALVCRRGCRDIQCSIPPTLAGEDPSNHELLLPSS